MSGWIRLQRGTLYHPAFDRTPFSEAEAWVWLIENAAFKDTKHRVGNKVETVVRGSMFCTLRGLAKEWRWKSDHKVRRFLDVLESENMIVKKNGAKKTHLTICNYNIYQDAGRKDGANTAQSGRTKEGNKQTTLLNGRANELYDAACVRDEFASPNLLPLSEPINWLANGCDFDLDIIPAVKYMASKGQIRSWKWCRDKAYENLDTRLAPPPEPSVSNFPKQSKKKPVGGDVARQMAEEARASGQ